MTLKEKITQLLGNGELTEAIDLAIDTSKNIDDHQFDTLVLLKSQNSTNENEYHQNRIRVDEYRLTKNKIQYGFQETLKKFPESVLNASHKETGIAENDGTPQQNNTTKHFEIQGDNQTVIDAENSKIKINGEIKNQSTEDALKQEFEEKLEALLKEKEALQHEIALQKYSQNELEAKISGLLNEMKRLEDQLTQARLNGNIVKTDGNGNVVLVGVSGSTLDMVVGVNKELEKAIEDTKTLKEQTSPILSGKQKRQFDEAFLSAFGSYAEMERMLDYIDIDLNTFSNPLRTLPDVVKDLRNYATKHNKLAEIIQGALAEVPGNIQLKQLSQTI